MLTVEQPTPTRPCCRADTHRCRRCLLSPHPRPVRRARVHALPVPRLLLALPAHPRQCGTIPGLPQPSPAQPWRAQAAAERWPWHVCQHRLTTAAASGHSRSLRDGRGLESDSMKAPPSLACQAKWMQRRLHSDGLFPSPTLAIFHGRTTPLTALGNSLEEQHPKEGTSHPAPGWLPLASGAVTGAVPAGMAVAGLWCLDEHGPSMFLHITMNYHSSPTHQQKPFF